MQSIVFFISVYSGVLVNARGNLDRFRAVVMLRNQGHDKRSEIWMSPITCGSIHEGHEWFGYYSRERRDFYAFGYISNFADSRTKSQDIV